jgi:chemotaxis protein methyltransferase CheR
MPETALERANGLRPLTRGEFEQIRRLAHERFGLDLREGKQQLISARLGKKLRESPFRTFREYCEYVIADSSGEALAEMIDALTTNYTSFLREKPHFEFLRKTVLAEFGAGGGLAVWSAACATGEEPYSIAISLLEELGWEARSRIRILATDISNRALETARQGVYPAERFEEFPAALLSRYFLRGEREWDGWRRVKREVRAMVEFRRLNLIEPFVNVPKFPVIFCRNVMIYFDKPAQKDLVRRLAECLEPGGYLLTGHAESLLGGDHLLEYVKPAVYRRRSEGGAAGGRKWRR